MASLKDLRTRIASIKATQKITKAMQMVAAAKLRRAQQAVEASRPFIERLTQVIGHLSAVANEIEAPKLLKGTGFDKTHLLLVCTSDRGLGGSFTSAIVRMARQHITELLKQEKTVKIICVGRKGAEQLRRLYGDMILDTVEMKELGAGFDLAKVIGERVTDLFDAGEFDVATLFYSQFKSVISQIPTVFQLIPAQVPPASEQMPPTLYSYEPDEPRILEALLPRNVNVQIMRALLENAASEQGARMSAMDNATRNAGEIIRRQTLLYNRTRQGIITKELIEIISGADAL